MSNQYMLLSNGPCMVPLKGDDSGFALVIAGKLMHFDRVAERLWIYWLYQAEDKGLFAEHLRSCVKGELTPMDIDSAVDQFVGERTPIPMDEYRLEDVPLIADPKNGLGLPIPGYCCVISAQNEKELMQMILNEPYDTVMWKLGSWFRHFCSDYGLDYKKCNGYQYKYLAESFLEQHGISPLPAKPKLEDNASQKYGDSVKWILIFIGVIVIWGIITTGLLNVGDKMSKESDSLLGPILFLAGLFCLGLPIYLISKPKK